VRGSPPIQLFLLAIAFALLAFPLARLTGNGAGSAREAAPAAAEARAVPALIRLRFAHRPHQIRLRQDERDLLAGADLSNSPVEIETRLRLGADGEELRLEAAWPEGTPDTAISVEIEPEGHETREVTRWSQGPELTDLLLFQW
jgi:hypothetical protein